MRISAQPIDRILLHCDVIKLFINIIRLAFAMVCVGICLIMTSQWLGLVPDERLVALEGRKRQCEVIAINAAAMIRSRNWPELDASLTAIVQRDDFMVSAGIRTESGYLRVGTDQHDAYWTGKEVYHGAPCNKMEVPITINQHHWGAVELCFEGVKTTGFAALQQHSLFRLVAFFAIAGMGAYSLFARRILRLFEGTQVVPDRVRQALDTFAEGLLVLDEKERIVVANRAFMETTMLDQDKLVGQRASRLPWLDEEERPATKFIWQNTNESSESKSESLLLYHLPDGTRRVFSTNSAPISGPDGARRGTLATFRDVTEVEEQRRKMERMLCVLQSSRDEIRQKNKELEVLATTDSLTGCLNRRAFFEKLARVWTETTAQSGALSCVMIDNDHFKSVNDTYGHHAGDEVLRSVSALLRQMHGEVDLVCRYGGEEFCVVLPGRDAKQAERHAEQIRIRIEALTFPQFPDLRITASLGVSDLSNQPTEPQDLINQADCCLYVAKRQGRNRVILYLPQFAAMDTQSEGREEANEPTLEQTIAVPFQAVMALVSALAFRDSETAEHSRRVADLVVIAAKGLLDQKETYILEIAALLHDIGKIGVPDNVLLKPGKLSAEEWQLMNKHDRIGVEIVAGTFNCDALTEIIRTHHAFFSEGSRDSSLPSGERIPLGARLLTICDSYDAMVSDRPYRKGRSHEEAVAELRRCSGTQFDPALVDHFIEKLESKRQLGSTARVAVPKQTALQIGLQIERLAEALDDRDADGLNVLASRVAHVARCNGVHEVAMAAEKLEQASASDDSDWLGLLSATVELLDLCRSTQNAFLEGTKRT